MPVTVEIPKERWTGTIREVTLGATSSEGGTRSRTVTVGGETTLPFLHFEGKIPHPPVIGVEVHDSRPAEWPAALLEAWGDVTQDPAAWAKKAEELGADVIMLRLRGTNADGSKTTPAQAAAAVKAVLQATGLPLVVRGPGQAETDNELLVAVAEAAPGERLALGLCEDKNYRTIVAGALALGHLVVASSPIDVNLAKQLNILISDMRLPLDRVLMDPTTGALGYGLEYTYSVMERLRLAALTGDGMTQQPMICFIGEESWRQKEARAAQGVPAEWGQVEKRGVTWETVTATALLESGADIVVLRHPKTISVVRDTITKLMAD
ncbi:MAG TPA: acetyl-CoA decarbonylase/synthase complex subunit delta [Anaerolineae bacterium]|nr:acetyl-CoA decarbonylase/synthase complex subunit delta [Anaerolineae bacterium]